MRSQTLALLLLPVLVLVVLSAGLHAGSAERRRITSGRRRGRAHVWGCTVAGAVVGLIGGAAVGALSGVVNHQDVAHAAVGGTYFMVPGMLLGLAAGITRWLVIRAARRRRLSERIGTRLARRR